MDLTQHLKDRHLNVALHRPAVDHDNTVVTFMLWNLSGQLCGYQQYRPNADKQPQNDPRNGRYFTYSKKDTVAVWGVESLDLTPGLVFVTEGVFDAARLTERGVSAVAVLSNNPSSSVRNWLKSLGRKVVAVCDNDAAGRKLASVGDQHVFTQGKDLGDSSDDFVDQLVKQFLTV